MISVDGDTSTNDMIMVLENGQAGGDEIKLNSLEFESFSKALETTLVALAKMVIKDGEGATKMFEVNVMGAASELDARKAARAVSSSSLVKSAIFGNDANWGRILCALGYSGADFDPSLVDLNIGSVPVMKKGVNLPFDEEEATKVLSQNELVITACLHAGYADAKAWGCDLTYDYVKINGSYRT
jgi:glutamate N-acetyltransferase/amino-acid N-acetyltransferase